jgi:hypothetical protein
VEQASCLLLTGYNKKKELFVEQASCLLLTGYNKKKRTLCGTGILPVADRI